MRAIPTINTTRLTLRGMRPQDFNAYAQLWDGGDDVAHIGSAPQGRGQAWDSFLRNGGHWQMAGFGQWAICNKDRDLIGTVGFSYAPRALGDDFDPYPEVAWAGGNGAGAWICARGDNGCA